MGYNTKKYSKQQEKRIAKNLGGKVQIGSGAVNLTGLKGDVSVTGSLEWDYLVEAKTKAVETIQESKRSITFKKEWIKEVQNHAYEQGKAMGVVAFSFDNQEDFYAIGSVDFENMIKSLHDYEQSIQAQNDTINQLLKIIELLTPDSKGIELSNFKWQKTVAPKSIDIDYNEENDSINITKYYNR